ncbi:MAG: hypothetical protein U9N62_09215 [Thermotogota bacterium]|nr:hypothetical protein [Thermotogota bacterium]
MNSKNKEDSKKQTTNPKKPENSRVRKNNYQKQGKRRPSKGPKRPPKKPTPFKRNEKNHTQNNEEIKKPEVEFISKATIESEWTIENIERYILAVQKAFEKIPETEKKEIDLREIWINSSLPADLILQIITDHGEKIGITKNSLYLDGKMIY